MENITVLIPLYTTDLGITDFLSVRRCFELLKGKYPIVFVKPESLDVTTLADKLQLKTNDYRTESFANGCFASRSTYNALLLSASFYERFLTSRYILIYQTDCYIFSDELDSWCSQGYDYVGAPWIGKSKYENPIYKTYMSIFRTISHMMGRYTFYDIVNHVGNGGLSLRRTALMYEICQKCTDKIHYYLNHPKTSLCNEDVFFSIESKREGFDIKIPDMKTALSFAFDVNPDQAFKLSGNKLPMGCHGWNKPWGLKFWRRFIEF